MNKSLVEPSPHRLYRATALPTGEPEALQPTLSARRLVLERFYGTAKQSEHELRRHGYSEIAHLVAVAQLATAQALAEIGIPDTVGNPS